jgi:phosphatidylserine synthase
MRLKYFGDVLSLLRALAVLLVAYFLWHEAWTGASVTVTLAWLTDPVDGWAAKKWGGLRDRYPNFDVDGIADTVLAVGSTVMIEVYMMRHFGVTSWQAVTVGVLVLACILGGLVMVLFLAKAGETPVTKLHRVIVGGNMVIGHSLLQIGATLVWLAYMSKGWDQAVAMTITLLCVAGLQREKIALWCSGQLRPVITK